MKFLQIQSKHIIPMYGKQPTRLSTEKASVDDKSVYVNLVKIKVGSKEIQVPLYNSQLETSKIQYNLAYSSITDYGRKDIFEDPFTIKNITLKDINGSEFSDKPFKGYYSMCYNIWANLEKDALKIYACDTDFSCMEEENINEFSKNGHEHILLAKTEKFNSINNILESE